MRKRIKCRDYSFLGTVLLIGFIGLYSCSSNTPTIRIKTDKNRLKKEQSESSPPEEPLSQSELPLPIDPKQTKDEFLAEQVNQILNHYVKAEELFAEGKLIEAEAEILLASNLVESRDVLLVLIKIYEKMGNKSKVDSCKKLLDPLKPIGT